MKLYYYPKNSRSSPILLNKEISALKTKLPGCTLAFEVNDTIQADVMSVEIDPAFEEYALSLGLTHKQGIVIKESKK